MMQESGEDALLKLAALLRQKGKPILQGKSKLSLTAVAVNYLNKCFKALEDKQTKHVKEHHIFLYEFVQGTVSLKLLQGARFRLGMIIDISFFKALRIIELNKVPLEFVQGISMLRPQLETLSCAHCSCKTLKEVFVKCGRDQSVPFPWINLTDVNINFDSIKTVDESLQYLTVLRSLDLGHNLLHKHDQEWPQLPALMHLNLGFNNFDRIPIVNTQIQRQLSTLIIKNNNLETLDGIQRFVSLSHLDLSNNAISRFSDLGPLANLHSLVTIHLHGNPIFFHMDYRLNVIAHLSPVPRNQAINLDGKDLEFSELSFLGFSVDPESPILYIDPVTSPLEVAPSPEVLFNPTIEDDLLVAQQRQEYEEQHQRHKTLQQEQQHQEQQQQQRQRTQQHQRSKKPLARVVSIADQSQCSEDGQADSEVPGHSEPEAEYTNELERIEKFRKQVGHVWLQAFPSLIEGEQDNTSVKSDQDSEQGETSEAIAPLSPKEVVVEASSIYDRSDSQDQDVDPDEGDSKLARSESIVAVPSGEEEDESPTYVVSMKTSQESEDEPEPMFIVLKSEHIQEKNFHGVVVNLLDLKCLLHITSKYHEQHGEKIPVICLNFDYINAKNQYREYFMDTQESLQDVLQILEPVVQSNNEKWIASRDSLHCLKCGHSFIKTDSTSEAVCPECESQMVIKSHSEQPGESASAPSTMLHSDSSVQVLQPFRNQNKTKADPDVIPDIDWQGEKDPDVCLNATKLIKAWRKHEEEDNEISSNESGFVRNECTEASSTDTPPPEDMSGGQEQENPGDASSKSQSPSSLPGSAFFKSVKSRFLGTSPNVSGDSATPSPDSRSSTPSMGKSASRIVISKDDYRTCDHRLRLHFEVSLFSDEADEVFKCILKSDIVVYGKSKPKPGLLIASNKTAYICLITGEESTSPSEWLTLFRALPLTDLLFLDYGLGSQTFRLEFDKPGAFFTFLVRDEKRCEVFLNYFIEISQEAKESASEDLVIVNRQNPQALANIKKQILGHHNEDMVEKGKQLYEQAVSCTNPPLIKTHKIRLKSYPDCFSGRDFVDWLIRCREALDRKEGSELGQHLLDIGIIYHINKEKQFEDKDYLYRFNTDMASLSVDKEASADQEEDELDTSVQVYLLAHALPHWRGAEQSTSEEMCAVTLLMTRSHVCLAEENFQWPLPRVLDPPALTSCQFARRDMQSITDVHAVELYKDSPRHVGIIFSGEGNTEFHWLLQVETEVSLHQFLSVLKRLWKSKFGIELQEESLDFVDLRLFPS